MQIKWHPDLVGVFGAIKAQDGDFLFRGDLPGYVASLVNSLYSSVHVPVIAVDETDVIPLNARYQRRDLESIGMLAQWSVDIIRRSTVDWFLAGVEEHRFSRLAEIDPAHWRYIDCNIACEVLRDELSEQSGVVDHDALPGAQDKEVCAFPENLASAMAFFFLNETLYALGRGDAAGALDAFASAIEFERFATSVVNQRVGYAVEYTLRLRELRQRGKKGGESKPTANGLKAWVDAQANPAGRSDRPFARALAKAAPQELVAGLADPERVIYDHLRRSLLGASS